jgi:hypothetical protein
VIKEEEHNLVGESDKAEFREIGVIIDRFLTLYLVTSGCEWLVDMLGGPVYYAYGNIGGNYRQIEEWSIREWGIDQVDYNILPRRPILLEILYFTQSWADEKSS